MRRVSITGKALESQGSAAALAARVLLALFVGSAGWLSDPFQYVGAQSAQEVVQARGEEGEASKSPADRYGTRYAARKLTMPKGMIRGTFDLVLGRLPDPDPMLTDLTGLDTATLNFGVAVSPMERLEVGFSRYRMGSYPNPDSLRAFGGDGLVPIIAQGRDLIPLLSTNDRAFGDLFAYARGEAVKTSIVDVAFDLGFLIPTASEFGVLIGLPIRFHGAEVFAFDTGLVINIDNIGGDGETITSISSPWNVVLSVTDIVFLKVNSGLNALDVGSDFPSVKIFPFGFGMGFTAPGERIMSDVFAAFSWPFFGTVLPAFGPVERTSETTTDVWTITLGVNFYSPVLF